VKKAEEHRLIELAAAGDRVAAGDLIRAYQASVYAYLLRLSGRPEVAEDITQEAFVRVLTNLDRFDTRYRFSPWLFTIAKRLFLNTCQKLKPAYDSDVVGAWQDSSGMEPDSDAIDWETRDNAHNALQQALMTLSTRQREIVILFHQQGWSIALIADHMDMPQGTVKSHLHRGRRRMRWFLEQHEQHSAHVGEIWQ
jgi:RNA polymerase sigma-70 factor (ECF subfamily)